MDRSFELTDQDTYKISETKPDKDSCDEEVAKVANSSDDVVKDSTMRPLGFLDLPGEIRNMIYEDLSASRELHLFNTLRQIRIEAASISSEFLGFELKLEHWSSFDNPKLDRIPALGIATAYVQNMLLTVDMDSRYRLRAETPHCPRGIEYLGGSDISRNECHVTLDYMGYFLTHWWFRELIGVGEMEVFKALRTLTGFTRLTAHVDSNWVLEDFYNGYRWAGIEKFEQIREALEPVLRPATWIETSRHLKHLEFRPLEFIQDG